MSQENKDIIGRIFHVDDDQFILEATAEDLAADTAHRIVLTAKSVAEALSYIPNRLIELEINGALLDGDLPDGSGSEVADAIRKAELGIVIASLSAKLILPTWGDVNIDKTDGYKSLIEGLDEAYRKFQDKT